VMDRHSRVVVSGGNNPRAAFAQPQPQSQSARMLLHRSSGGGSGRVSGMSDSLPSAYDAELQQQQQHAHRMSVTGMAPHAPHSRIINVSKRLEVFACSDCSYGVCDPGLTLL